MAVARFEIRTSAVAQLVEITAQVRDVVRASGVAEGIAVVWCSHTTAGITEQENADPSVRRDLLAALDRLVPREGDYRHPEGNSDGHIKSTLCGRDVTLIVEDGALVLGTWQGVFLCEFDGPRARTVAVKVLPG